MNQLVSWVLFLLVLASCGTQPKKEEPASQVSAQGFAAKHHRDRNMAEALDAGDRQRQNVLIDQTVDGLVRMATAELRQRGHKDEAVKWETSYHANIENYWQRMNDIGDHRPWSDWLDAFYAALQLTLGDQVCHALHLDDIWTINYAIPVVFDPTNKLWDEHEYSLHFIPFCGVVGYWTTYIGCAIGTWGSGAITLVCTPIGMIARRIMVNHIAPPLSDRVYERANN